MRMPELEVGCAYVGCIRRRGTGHLATCRLTHGSIQFVGAQWFPQFADDMVFGKQLGCPDFC